MKKLLFATVFASTALASSMGCNTDSLTGLHFGLGVSVLFDKYEADVDVGTSAPYAKKIDHVTITGIGGSGTQNNVQATDVSQLITDIWNGVPALVALGQQNPPQAKKFADTSETTPSANLIDYQSSTYSADRSLFIKKHTFNKRTVNCGGEIKLAYFHDFGNHLMIGVDLTGVIASKNKKTINVVPEMPQYPEALSLTPGGTSTITNVTSIDPSTGTVTGTPAGTLTDSELIVGTTFKDLYETNKESGGVLLDGAIYDASGGTTGEADKTFNEMALITAQYKVAGVDTKDNAQLTFEKSVFNPRLAFIIGGTVYGWFAGVRLGMSYTTGKVYATGGSLTGQGTQSRTVSISSPLIGLHLMKQLKIAGNNDAHLYLTADWNIGDGRRSVYMNGVKNFRQTGYNISAGLTWRFKLGN